MTLRERIRMESRLRKIREAKGLSIRELADLTGLSYHTIYKIELGGEQRTVHEKTAQLLSDVLRVKVEDLFTPEQIVTHTRPPLTGGKYNKREE